MRWAVAAMVAGVSACAGCAPDLSPADIAAAVEHQKQAKAGADEIHALQRRARGLTYTATYEARTKAAGPKEIVIAQNPPRSMYDNGTIRLIDDGHVLYSCTAAECVEVGTHPEDLVVPGVFRANNVFEVMDADFGPSFNPLTLGGAYLGVASSMVSEIRRSTREVAGQTSECYTARQTPQAAALEWCIGLSGIFTFSDDGRGSIVELTRLEEAVDEASFLLPAPVRKAASPGPSAGLATTPTT